MSAETPDLGEFELIERFVLRRQAARGAQSGVILGIGDDAAVLAVPPDAELVAAVDSIVAGRHFPEGTDARSIGHRALAVNLSDFAAMGATPAWATLALTMPSVDAHWLERFSSGFLDLADVHGVALVGGDTTRGPLTVSVQVLGHIPRGTALRRALELIRRFEYPAPRVRFGLAARGIATAAMDLSDGLIGDLPKLARASGLAAQVAVERLPLSEAMCIAAPGAQARDWALAAGDDYEMLLAVPAPRYAELKAEADRLNLMLTTIGELRAGGGVTWTLNGREFLPSVRGWDHFA